MKPNGTPSPRPLARETARAIVERSAKSRPVKLSEIYNAFDPMMTGCRETARQVAALVERSGYQSPAASAALRLAVELMTKVNAELEKLK